jgi:hypothetical protein
MNSAIIPHLVRKDFLIMRKTILIFALVSLASIGIIEALYARIPDWVLVNMAFVLLLGPAATCGMVVLMKTNVFEKEKSTQPFIMSLPVTVREFTVAKLLINVPVFAAFWLVVSGVGFYFAFGRGLFPPGAVPFVIMVFLGVFVAYTCILSVSLLFQSLAATVLSITLFETATSAYLWTIAYFEPIGRHVQGPDIVWNQAAITIVATQGLVAIVAILATLHIQNRKRDFI